MESLRRWLMRAVATSAGSAVYFCNRGIAHRFDWLEKVTVRCKLMIQMSLKLSVAWLPHAVARSDATRWECNDVVDLTHCGIVYIQPTWHYVTKYEGLLPLSDSLVRHS